MFDDQPAKSALPPKNLPTEPVDMFAGVEAPASVAPVPVKPAAPNALSAGVLKKKEAPLPPVETPPTLEAAGGESSGDGMYVMKAPKLGKIILIVFLVAAAVGLGWLGWWAYGKFFNAASVAPAAPAANLNTERQIAPPANLPAVTEEATTTPTSIAAETNITPAPAATSTAPTEMNNDKILFGEAVDSDKDGLDDIREKDLGTDPRNPDTDGDGLSDGDEVLIWHTNPLNPDTDGDGFPDGKEVRNGYNPLGPGKLFNNAPASSTAATSTNNNTTTRR